MTFSVLKITQDFETMLMTLLSLPVIQIWELLSGN